MNDRRSKASILKDAIKGFDDTHQVFINAGDLRVIGVPVEPQSGQPAIPDGRPTPITVGAVKTALGRLPAAAFEPIPEEMAADIAAATPAVGTVDPKKTLPPKTP